MKVLNLVPILLWAVASVSAQTSNLQRHLPENQMPELAALLGETLQSARDITARRLVEEQALGAKIATRAAVLPQAKGNVEVRQENDFADEMSSGFDQRVIYGFTVTQPIYHWGINQATKEIGEIGYDSELLGTSNTMRRVLGSARRQYLDLVIAKQNREHAERVLDLTWRKMNLEKERAEGGTVSEDRIFQLEIDARRKELTVLRLAEDFESKVENLAVYLGTDSRRIRASLSDSIPTLDPLTKLQIESLDRLFTQAIDVDESLRRKEMEIEKIKRSVHIERNQLKPNLDMQLGVSQNALDTDGILREQEFFFAGVRVNWRVFDGFRTKGRTMEALARLKLEEEERAVLEESLVRRYERALSSLLVSSESLRIEEELFALRGSRIAEREKDFQEQSISQIQWDEAQIAFFKQSIDIQRSRANYMNALSSFAIMLSID